MNWPDNEIEVVVVARKAFDGDNEFDAFRIELREAIERSQGGVLLNCEQIETASGRILTALHEMQSETLTMRKRFALFRVSNSLFECISAMRVDYPLQCYSIAKPSKPESKPKPAASAPAAASTSYQESPINFLVVVLISTGGLLAVCVAYGIYLYLSF